MIAWFKRLFKRKENPSPPRTTYAEACHIHFSGTRPPPPRLVAVPRGMDARYGQRYSPSVVSPSINSNDALSLMMVQQLSSGGNTSVSADPSPVVPEDSKTIAPFVSGGGGDYGGGGATSSWSDSSSSSSSDSSSSPSDSSSSSSSD